MTGPSNTLSPPERADAAVVWRRLVAVGFVGAAVEELSRDCFPIDADVTLGAAVAVLRKRSVRRVLDAVVWMRGQGVVVVCVAGIVSGEMSRFVIESPD